MNKAPAGANAALLLARLRRFAFRFFGGMVFFVGVVLIAVYLPMLALVMLGQLTPGPGAGQLETVPSLTMLITLPLVGAGLIAAGVVLRRFATAR